MIVLKNKLLFLLGICMFVLACNKGNEAEIELLCEKGKLYIDYNQHDSAIVCLTQAKALLNQQTDFTLRGRLYSYLGSIWKSKMDWQRSEFYYNKALEAYRQAGNKTKEAWNMLFLGDVLRLKDKQTSQSLDYYHKALSMNLSNDTLKGNAIQRIGLYYYYRHETDSALRYLKESLNYPYTGKEQSVRLLFTGVAFYEAQQPDSAERYLKLALQHPNGLRQQSGCYNMLHQIATDRNDTAAMAHYGNICMQYKDSIMRMETRMSNRFIDLKHQETSRERTHKTWLAVLLFALVGAVSAVAWTLYPRWVKRKRLLQLTVLRKKELETQLTLSIQREKEQNLLLHSKEHLAELTKNKEQRLHDFQEQKARLLGEKWKDWTETERTADILLNGFFVRLQCKHPGLKEQEKRMCLLVLLDCSQQEMADLLYMAKKSIGVTKMRLANNLGTTSSKMQQYLTDFIGSN